MCELFLTSVSEMLRRWRSYWETLSLTWGLCCWLWARFLGSTSLGSAPLTTGTTGHSTSLRYGPVGMTGVRWVGMAGVRSGRMTSRAVSSIQSGARLGRPSWHHGFPRDDRCEVCRDDRCEVSDVL